MGIHREETTVRTLRLTDKNIRRLSDETDVPIDFFIIYPEAT